MVLWPALREKDISEKCTQQKNRFFVPAPGPYTLSSGPGSLNPLFRPRGLSKQIGDVFKLVRYVFCIDLHVEMLETIVQSLGCKHFGIFNILGGSFTSPSGEKSSGMHQNKKQSQY